MSQRHEGYLTKTNRKGKDQQRYFVLDGGVLSFYKQPLGKRLGVIDLRSSEVVGLGLRYFLINAGGAASQEQRKFVVSGKDAEETQRWKRALLEARGGGRARAGRLAS